MKREFKNTSELKRFLTAFNNLKIIFEARDRFVVGCSETTLKTIEIDGRAGVIRHKEGAVFLKYPNATATIVR